jgi:hypothetical protein
VSDTTTISKDIEVTIDHVICDCGANLGFSVDGDRNGNLKIIVEEHKCLQEKE